MVDPDRFVAFEIGNGPSYLEDPIMRSCGQPEPLDDGFQERLSIGPDGAVSANLLDAHLGITEGSSSPESLLLESSGPFDPHPHLFGGLSLRIGCQLPITQWRHIEVQVDPVQ